MKKNRVGGAGGRKRPRNGEPIQMEGKNRACAMRWEKGEGNDGLMPTLCVQFEI